MTDPRGGIHSYAHSSDGELVTDTDAAGGAQQLSRIGDGNQWEVTLRSAMGRERRYAVEKTVDGGVRRSNTGTDGLVTESVAQTDGRRSTTLPDGTTIETMLGPDPRFGMAAPITKSIKLRTPSGLERTETFERAVTLENPDDPLSLTRQEDRYPPSAPSTEVTGFTYDLDRRLIRVDQPESRSVQLSFSTAGQLETLTHPGGVVSMAYDPASGRLSTLTAPGSTLGFSYDGPLVTGTTWSGDVAGSVSWSYDTELRLATERVGGGSLVTWQYDRDELPVRVGELVIARDAETGFETETILGSVTTRRSFNSVGELAGIEASIAGAAIYRLELGRNKAGRIVAKTETVGGETHRFDYAYDLDGQLVRVERDGLPWSEHAYDSAGNRLSYRGVLGDADGLYDDQDRMLQYGDKSYGYTAAGELQTKTQGEQTIRFGYDALGALKTVRLAEGIDVEYLSDALGRRIGKKVNGVLVQGFLYANELKPIAELDGTGNVVARFVYGTNAIVPDYLVKGNVTYRIVADQLGSVRLIVDATTGELVQRLDYDELGRVLLDTNPGFQPFGFAGGLYDPQTKLVRFGLRDYDPEVGRWTAKDPILVAGGVENPYAYVLNDPINLIDPTGLDWITTAATISAGIGDALLFGFGDELRGLTDDLFGLTASGLVDICSNAYRTTALATSAASLAFGIGRFAYAGAAKGISLYYGGRNTAEAAASAVRGRNLLKRIFRLGTFPRYRIYQPDKILRSTGSFEGAIASAGRTNANWNRVGTYAAPAGASSLSDLPECECR
ncbi:MAG: RHS repeat-associated core domain-containing protein [Thermoanaerobaculia bacterium]|nr:RHS repeat-associated core domain-containing protein [Thermoanaerobaculia bacterium]